MANPHRDEFTFRVALEHGHTFVFTVQDWDTEDAPLADEQVLAMARGLLDDGAVLYGTLDGRTSALVLDPARVVALGLEH